MMVPIRRYYHMRNVAKYSTTSRTDTCSAEELAERCKDNHTNYTLIHSSNLHNFISGDYPKFFQCY